jgi:LPS O-antigen subunit length determinant protein (WzzB/FepE family)
MTPNDGGPKLDLAEVVRFAFRSWRTLLLAGFAGGCLGVGATYLIEPVFEAEVVVAPVSHERAAAGVSALRSQFGGLAQFAGIDLGGGEASDREEAMATLKSDSFAREFIESEGLMPVLFAEQWDAGNSVWERPDRAPSLNDGVELFTESVRFISEDRKTNLASIRIEWTDPQLAASWANKLVAMVNARLRQEAMQKAERSLDYLNRELANTNVVELRAVLYRLIETELSAKTLATVQPEYAFRVIDPAVAPELKQKIRPRRALTGIAVATGVGVVTLLVLIWRRRESFFVGGAPSST